MLKLDPISTSIKELNYNPRSLTLKVTFKTGRAYEYYGVPPLAWEIALFSESVGSFYQKQIKGNYPSTKIS
jgi:hypothetical protein